MSETIVLKGHQSVTFATVGRQMRVRWGRFGVS